MDDFYNYTKFKTFWWILYLEYAEFLCKNPEFSVRSGFNIDTYFQTREGRLFKRRFEKVAWAD